MCAALLRAFDRETVATRSVTARYYDDPNSGRMVAGSDGRTHMIHVLVDGDPIAFTLARVRGLRRP